MRWWIRSITRRKSLFLILLADSAVHPAPVICSLSTHGYMRGITNSDLPRHRLHFYTGFGDRNRSETEKEFARSVYGPDAAERAIAICEALIEQAVRSFPSAREDAGD
jgi:hypothetical protein